MSSTIIWWRLPKELHESGDLLVYKISFPWVVGGSEHILRTKIAFSQESHGNITKEAGYILDFGFAKWLPSQWTHHFVTPIQGTFGSRTIAGGLLLFLDLTCLVPLLDMYVNFRH